MLVRGKGLHAGGRSTTNHVVSSTLIAKVKELCAFPDASESHRIISGLKWLGLFSTEKVKPRDGNLLDTLCARMENLMKFEEGERDFVMLQHKFVVEYPDGKQVSWNSTVSL